MQITHCLRYVCCVLAVLPVVLITKILPKYVLINEVLLHIAWYLATSMGKENMQNKSWTKLTNSPVGHSDNSTVPPMRKKTISAVGQIWGTLILVPDSANCIWGVYHCLLIFHNVQLGCSNCRRKLEEYKTNPLLKLVISNGLCVLCVSAELCRLPVSPHRLHRRCRTSWSTWWLAETASTLSRWGKGASLLSLPSMLGTGLDQVKSVWTALKKQAGPF